MNRNSTDCAVVTPWHNRGQIEAFCEAWAVDPANPPDYMILQHDASREGCAVTKNRGIAEAVRCGIETVVVLDDDCFPDERRSGNPQSLDGLIAKHLEALKPQPVELFEAVTDPPSRGTPYESLTVEMPVAASMGFWSDIGDYCAVRQLAYSSAQMSFSRKTISGRYFPLCGMNLAFRPLEWEPWCSFIDVGRFDDIWMGWLWQKEAYSRGACFNLSGPTVRHSRQSDVWKNLAVEGLYLKENETLWAEIALSKLSTYDELLYLLPHVEGEMQTSSNR